MGDNLRAWSGNGESDIEGPTVTRTASAAAAPPPALKTEGELRGAGYLVAVGSRTARFRRKHQNKLIRILLLGLMILLLSLAITMTVLYWRHRRPRAPPPPCESRECLRSAANLALSMDLAADPCDDFYQYVCGNWASEHPPPVARGSHDWFHLKYVRVQRMLRDYLARNHSGEPRPVRQAADMYSACVNTETLDKLRLHPILDALEMLGLPQYPTYLNLTDGFDYETYTFDWLLTVVRVKTLLGMDVLVGFDIFTDPKNSSVYRLAMGSPGTTNPFPSMHSERKKRFGRRSSNFRIPTHPKENDDFFVSNFENEDSEEEDERKRRLYKVYYAEVMKAVFLDSEGVKLTQLPESEIDNIILQAADEYISLTNTFYELESSSGNDTADDDYNFIVPEYTVDGLQDETDRIVSINNGTATPLWRAYLTGVFNVSDENVDFDEDKILVSEPDLKYLALLAAYFSKASAVSIELYIWMQVVEVMVVHTTSELRALHERYYALLRGAGADDAPPPRSLACAAAVNTMLGMAVSYAIVDDEFIHTTKPKVELMLENIKQSLRKLVRDASWMDRGTKEATYEKITKMKSLIGFPNWLLNEGELDEYYKGVEIEADKHLMNLINIVQARLKKGLNKFHKPNNLSWATDPTDVNAFHTFQENTITVPLVMLQYPFYDLGLESLNYGALGTVLGHEITHGFDNIGRQFDQDGNLVPWWSNQTVESFVNRTQCFVRQYSGFYLPEIDDYVNGKHTLSENIADGGGVREALGAYRLLVKHRGPERHLPGFENYTSEQLFFLSYGNLWCSAYSAESLKEDLEDVHSPNHVRPRGALQNSEEFARAFRCRPNTTMNPVTRCVIF